MKFRQHRGGLAESMETVVEIKNRDELVGYLRGILWQWPTAPPVSDETIEVRPYADGGGDDRIGWKKVYIVTLKDYGVLGWTDGPAPTKAGS